MRNTLEKFKVLIVDDSTIARLSLKKMLTERNFEIIESVDGLDAIDKVKVLKPDLILMDYLMPRMNGLIALKILRANGNSTPVLIVSANQQDATKHKFNELGISGIIKKHPDKTELLRQIDIALNIEKDQ